MKKKFALIMTAILLIVSCLMAGCLGEEWHTCTKCKGSGKMRNDLGYYVTCTRCEGEGGFYY